MVRLLDIRISITLSSVRLLLCTYIFGSLPLEQKVWGNFYSQNPSPIFFRHFNLKSIKCEPNANNPAPNKVLPKIGFKFIKNMKQPQDG